MFEITLIPAFKDNYIWLLTGDNRRAAVVDPGDAAPVLAYLDAHDLTLESILIENPNSFFEILECEPGPEIGGGINFNKTLECIFLKPWNAFTQKAGNVKLTILNN
jgi:hypothetical protein